MATYHRMLAPRFPYSGPENPGACYELFDTVVLAKNRCDTGCRSLILFADTRSASAAIIRWRILAQAAADSRDQR
jgi:hypothetical protein